MEIILVFIGLQVLCGVILYLVLKRFFLRWFAKTGQLERIQSEIERMLVDLNHTTSNNIDLIEERIAKVKEVASEIDKRILMLRKELEKNDKGKNLYNSIIEQPKRDIPKAPSNPVVSGEKDKKEHILELYNAGFSLSVIAHKVGTSVGEVELILSLQQKE
ncbi:MAG: hypothetical protein JW904_08345 [Spirochaetales bacterium]|nr:hypothetical protein [Spirochaetales bacterium]